MTKQMPLFMENEKWYAEDGENGGYILLPGAPQEAIYSFIEYYTEILGEEEAKRRVEKAERALAMSNFGIPHD